MNEVRLLGKVSRAGGVRYTPSGVPTLELTLAVRQQLLEKVSTGYFEIVLFGELAEKTGAVAGIGKQLQVQGRLWGRRYKNRDGRQVTEFKIVAERAEIVASRRL